MFTPFLMYFLEKVDSPSLTVRYTNSMTGNRLFARYLNYNFFFTAGIWAPSGKRAGHKSGWKKRGHQRF